MQLWNDIISASRCYDCNEILEDFEIDLDDDLKGMCIKCYEISMEAAYEDDFGDDK